MRANNMVSGRVCMIEVWDREHYSGLESRGFDYFYITRHMEMNQDLIIKYTLRFGADGVFLLSFMVNVRTVYPSVPGQSG